MKTLLLLSSFLFAILATSQNTLKFTIVIPDHVDPSIKYFQPYYLHSGDSITFHHFVELTSLSYQKLSLPGKQHYMLEVPYDSEIFIAIYDKRSGELRQIQILTGPKNGKGLNFYPTISFTNEEFKIIYYSNTKGS